MEDRPMAVPDGKYFNELLEVTHSSADVSEPITDDMEEAIAPMSASYGQSI
jgi:hypothetical protein